MPGFASTDNSLPLKITGDGGLCSASLDSCWSFRRLSLAASGSSIGRTPARSTAAPSTYASSLAKRQNPPLRKPTPRLTQPTQPQEVASNAGEQPRGPESVTTLPAGQTISRNPPNGIVTAGSGKFELYRQGDLTFRLNTDTGDACVLLATQAEWSKNIVYSHGCNSH